MNIGFLVSQDGSNMQAIIDACKTGALHAYPAVVISNNSESGAIARAQKEGIPWFHLSGKTHPNPEELDQAILDVMLAHGVDLIVLAGYMKKNRPKDIGSLLWTYLKHSPGFTSEIRRKGHVWNPHS